VGLAVGTPEARFERGSTVQWWGTLAPRFRSYESRVLVRWIAPNGAVVLETPGQIVRAGELTAAFPTADQPPGDWQVEVLVADTRAALQRFALDAPGLAGP